MHKRVLLHPFSVMVLLCVGVIIAGSTFQGSAASYDVAASVPAQLPASPAFITQPAAAEHVTNPTITVAGTCPPQTYVKVFRNGAFMGAAQCSNKTFQVQMDLLPGSNDLQAKVYNVTNSEGPPSPAVTVYYDDTTLQPQTPPSTPSTVQIMTVENDSYRSNGVLQTSVNPTITGFAPPFSEVIVTFYSDPVTCKTQANEVGWWSCTLQQALPPGVHHVEVWAHAPSGDKISFPLFAIQVRANLPNVLKPRNSSIPPLLFSTDYYFQTHYIGQPFRWNIGFSGGTAPYKLEVDWGDDSQSTITRSDGNSFTLTHAYPASKTYTVFMKVTDSQGVTAMLQLSAVVKEQPISVASITNTGPVASFLASIKRYLWIVWPVYIAVVLMVLSYWLGEQEMYQRLTKRRRPVRSGKGH